MRALALIVVVGCYTAPAKSPPSTPLDPTQPGAVPEGEGEVHAGPVPPDGPPAPAKGRLPESGKLVGVAEVRVGSFIEGHAGCVRFVDGRVACWAGPNLLLSFGQGRKQPVPGPDLIAGLTDATRFTDGSAECASVKRGGFACWQGDGPATAAFPKAVEVASDSNHVCVLDKSGAVQCSGKNYNGELGYEPPPDLSQTFDFRPVPGATNIAHIAGGAGLCGLRADGTLYCWGNHPFRAPAKTRDELVAAIKPGVVAGITGVRRMVLGGMPCLVLDKDVKCGRGWDGTARIKLEVVPLGVAAGDIVDIDSAGYSVCAVAKSGAVTCWGPGPRPYTMDGGAWQKQLDAGYRKARVIPTLTDAAQISISDMYGCVATRAGHARCWGDNEYGERGDGTLGGPISSVPTWVQWFHPREMPGPGEEIFGCRPVPAVARACQDKADAGQASCALEAPPDYWSLHDNRGTLCDERCMQQHMDELRRRAVPACECSCMRDTQGPLVPIAPPPPRPQKPAGTAPPGPAGP